MRLGRTIADLLTTRRRLVLALVLSAAVHGGLLGLGRRQGPAAPVSPAPGGERFAVAMVERGAAPDASAPEAAAVSAAEAPPEPPNEPPVAPAPREPSRPAPVVRKQAPERVRAPEPAVRPEPVAPVRKAPSEEAAARVTTRPAVGAGAGSPGAGSGGAQPAALAAAGPPGATSAGDLRPWCRACPTPDYPARARRRGWQGTVEVDLELNDDGGVDGARVVRSSGFPALDQAAVAVARRSRFRVPSAGGALRGKLRYQFRLDRSL